MKRNCSAIFSIRMKNEGKPDQIISARLKNHWNTEYYKK